MPNEASPFTVPALYHPTVAVNDLDFARDWFSRLFGRKPLRWEDTLDLSLLTPGYPTNYSFFAFVCDVHWVFLCPPLHAAGSLRAQTRYKDVPDGMIGLGWYTDNAVGLFDRLIEFGYRSHDQLGQRITSEKPPVSSYASDVLTGFTEPEDTGIRYEFQETGRRHWAKYAEQADPRLRPGWQGPRSDPADPLGLACTSHHTIVTRDLPRALRFYVEALHAEPIGQQRNDELQGDATFVRLGDTVLEFLVPDAGSAFHDTVAQGRDRYHAVTYQVHDSARALAHIRSVGIVAEQLPGGVVVVRPEHGLGVEWRFVTELPYPAAQRRVARFAA